jgi:hypothetical protein
MGGAPGAAEVPPDTSEIPLVWGLHALDDDALSSVIDAVKLVDVHDIASMACTCSTMACGLACELQICKARRLETLKRRIGASNLTDEAQIFHSTGHGLTQSEVRASSVLLLPADSGPFSP